MKIEAEAAELIRRWNSGLSQSISVRFILGHDERGPALKEFLDAFTKHAPKVRFIQEESNEGELTAILVGDSVRWHAIPEGGELMPFLKNLEMHVSSGPAAADIPEALRSRIASVSLPADIKVFVAPQCPFCPRVLNEILPFALLNPLLHLAVIDGVLFPELSESESIRSVPTVILDGEFRWTGAGHSNEIVDALLNRDPAGLSAKSLENFLKGGNAELLAQMMIDRRQVFPAFTDLLENSDWTIRLGAMVVVEEIAEKSPGLLEEVLELVWSRLHRIKGPARGDAVYLFGLGQSGSDLWIDRLKGLNENEDEEARESVIEALEKLSGK